MIFDAASVGIERLYLPPPRVSKLILVPSEIFYFMLKPETEHHGRHRKHGNRLPDKLQQVSRTMTKRGRS